MKKKTILIISLIFVTTVLFGILAAMLLLREKPTLPSKATEQGPTCPANSGSCTWSSDDTATSFKVKIVDQTTGNTVLEKTTSDKKVDFTPVANHSYKCTVTPENSCGKGPEKSDTSACILITGTPSPSQTPTTPPPPDSTPTVTPEFTLTPTLTLTPSPTDEISSTPTVTPEISETPGPTETATPTKTPAPTSTSQPVFTYAPSYTSYPSSPTIPESGIPANWLFMLVPVAIIFIGLVI